MLTRSTRPSDISVHAFDEVAPLNGWSDGDCTAQMIAYGVSIASTDFLDSKFGRARQLETRSPAVKRVDLIIPEGSGWDVEGIGAET